MSELRKEARSRYYEALSLESSVIDHEGTSANIGRSANETDNSAASIVRAVAPAFKLPTITLPSFDGDLAKWPAFKDTYLALIHNNPDLTAIHKYHYLRSSLKGVALQAIAIVPLTELEYPQAWEALLKKYDSKRLQAMTHLTKIFNYKQMTKVTLGSIQHLTEVVFESITAFRRLALEDESGFILMTFVLRLITPQLRDRFETTRSEPDAIPTLANLMDFIHRQSLCHQAELLAIGSTPGSTSSQDSSKAAQNTKRILHAQEASQSPRNCPFCKQNHLLFRCDAFRQRTPTERHAFVRSQKNMCFNCLSASHFTSTCNSGYVCRTCGQRHHTLIHVDNHHVPTKCMAKPAASTSTSDKSTKRLENQYTRVSKDQQTEKQSVLSTASPDKMNVLLGTALAHMRGCDGKWHAFRMVIDSGAQRSFVTTELTKRLGLNTRHNPHRFCGFGDSPISGGNTQVTCTISPMDHREELVTDAVVMDQISSYMPSYMLADDIKSKFSHQSLADSSFGDPGPIDFLLGADLFPHILANSSHHYNQSSPAALPTIFGWVVMGRLPKSCHFKPDRALLALSTAPQDMSELLERFWKIEEVQPTPQVDPLDTYCEEHFQKTHQRTSSGRYMVRLPFHTPPPEFHNSRNIAVNRYYRLETKLGKDTTLKNAYAHVMKDHLNQGYLSLSKDNGRYFLPHRGVLKESTSTSLRIVYDASAATSAGSLNDFLCTGPKLQNELRDVLLIFRLHPHAMAADICQMYLQIAVHPEDRVFQHFVYRFNPNEALENYQLNRVTFGLSCSPFLAIRVLRQLTIDEGAEFPHASRVLKEDIYIDDILTSTRSQAEGLALQAELIQLLNKAGFVLKKWCSNDPSLLKATDEPATCVSLSDMEDAVVKVLGLEWNPSLDCLSYTIQLRPVTFTKRGLMSTIARLYDPLGFLAPVVFRAKTILQKLWKLNLDWDEAIPKNVQEEWSMFVEELPSLREIAIPRCLFPSEPQSVDVVGFADASNDGYAAVIYLRITLQTGIVQTPLIYAKTKLAPLRTQTIPRLELCAALLLIRTVQALSKFLDRICIHHTYLCLDSTTVLNWIQLPVHRLKTFVANRVAILQEASVSYNWCHVPTTENMADIASRGCAPSRLMSMPYWWQGPDWLRLSQESWPVKKWDRLQDENILPETKPDAVMMSVTVRNTETLELIERTSSYTKIINVLAYCLRFIHNCRLHTTTSQPTRRSGHLQLAEIREAQVVVLKAVQHEHFSSQTASTKLTPLMPVYDNQGILRVGGRLANAPLINEARRPILLPGKGHFVRLLINHYHVTHLHAGPQLLLSIIRQRFWIISARQIIRKSVHQCLRCHQLRVQGYAPFMSDLPASRFTQGRAFLNVGVDFAGPFSIRESLRRKAAVGKAYVCLFICMSTKAVHCEVVSKLSTEAFLACLDRFIARRGLPNRLFSDQGTNFVGAQRHLKELQEWWDQAHTRDTLMTHANRKEIQWTFNPPSAPHFGGLWEAGIKSFKTHLVRLLDARPLTFEEMATVASRIEALLNSRPLYPITSDPEDYDVLTPGHFLIGAPLCSKLERDFVDTSPSRLSRWEFLQRCTQELWKKWRHDYLHHLQQRGKWTQPETPIEEGTLVLLKDDNAPPLDWVRGRIIKCHPGPDGHIRVVTVQTPKGTYTRPLVKLAPLLPEAQEIQRFFRPISLSRFEDLIILNVSSSEVGEVSFQFFGDRADVGKVREAVARLGDRRRLGEVTTLDGPALHHEQGLHLVGVSMNSRDVVRENDQIIISCVAQGSDQIAFNWYKNGYRIDVNKASGGLWMKYLPKNSKDEYTAILVIESARAVDEGQYTCQAVDWRIQECKSIYLEIQGPPTIEVSPVTVSLHKGDGITLQCVSPHKEVWYSWTRDNNLFPLTPDLEVWEDLKPWGSILRVSNIQKSTTYTCHAHTSTATRETNVRIDILSTGACKNENFCGLDWRDTAPGSTATSTCPLRYTGIARRYCLTKGPGEAVWEEPDFSNCISKELQNIIHDFQLISRGYMKTTLLTLLSELYSWYSSQNEGLRGEGELVLEFLGDVLDFVNSTFTPVEMLNVTKVFYANIDLLLSRLNSIFHEEKVGKLQILADRWSLLWIGHTNSSFDHLSYDEVVIDTMKLTNNVQDRYYIPPTLSNKLHARYPRWYTARIAIDLMGYPGNQASKVAIVNYHNISKFLPKISTQMLSDGTELSYELHSNIISISTGGGINMRLELTIPVNEVRIGWNLTCGRTDLLGLEWDFSSCHHVVRTGNMTQCRCHKPGVYAALMTQYSSMQGQLYQYHSFILPSAVALGCSCCLVQTFLSLLLLMTKWWSHRTCTLFFKIQSCFSVSLFMCIFVYASKIPPQKDMFLVLTIVLESFFFLGLSSHLGKLLVIYSEVVYIPNFRSAKYTVFGLMAGVTLLTCLISLLAESLSDRKNDSWWLPPSSPSFYTAGISATLLVCLYILLVISLFRRLMYLRKLKDPKSNYIITRRLGLLKRTTFLFVSLMSVAVSSVLFVNFPDRTSTYAFSLLSALLGFLMVFCYIVHGESSFNRKLMKQLKITVKDSEYSSDADYNLFSFYTKEDPEVESEGAPHQMMKGESLIPMKDMSDHRLEKHEIQNLSGSRDLPFYEQTAKNVDLEVYPESPKKYQKSIAVDDGSSNLVTALDIVQEIEKLGLTTLIDQKTFQEDQEECTSGVSPTDVLNQISHDLDYLLNRTLSPSHRPAPEVKHSSTKPTKLVDKNDSSTSTIPVTKTIS